MLIFKRVIDLQHYLAHQKPPTTNIGFIPTMGALHAGHTSLIKKAKADGNFVVSSLFVNPTQFNDKADYDKYPVTVDDDIAMLIEAGCDVLFLPSVQEIYPNGTEQIQTYDLGYLDTILEGAKRPGHFKGVGQVVGRLLEIVQPQYLYLGQKDYQQCMVLNKLLDIMGISNKLKIIICPTVREADGLAMSSRNRRLTEPQRLLAATIYQCLISIQTKQFTGNFKVACKECEDLLAEKGFKPEYVALADARDLTLLDNYDSSRPMIALIAAKLGNVRLIDNLFLN